MNTIKKIFLILFLFSTLGTLILFVSSSFLSTYAPVTGEPGISPTAAPDAPSTVDPSTQNSSNLNSAALIGSAITSITSLIGFIMTTLITWRKEKREDSLADVQRKKLETELEKSRLELEELKKSKKRNKK